MGTSVKMIDVTYGHLVADAEAYERGLLNAYDARSSAPPELGGEAAPRSFLNS